MDFRFRGIPADVAMEVRTTMRAPDYGHPAYKALAQSYGPCRLCLRTFRIGEEERILFTYNPFPQDELPAPGPVFIHARACERYDSPALPPELRALPMVLEGYGLAGELLTRERAAGYALEPLLERIFVRDGARYVHIRNGEAGCFMARVDLPGARTTRVHGADPCTEIATP
jgi:Protein of unknown function (DUF1203)